MKRLFVIIIAIVAIGYGVYYFKNQQNQEAKKSVKKIVKPKQKKDGIDLYNNGLFAEAKTLLKEEINSGTASNISQRAYFLAQILKEENDIINSWKYFTLAYNTGDLNYKQKKDLNKIIIEYENKIIYTPYVKDLDSDFAVMYQVKPGDTLGKIAVKLKSTVNLIKKINKLQSNIIHPDDEYKVVPLNSSVKISLKNFELALFISSKSGDKYLYKIYDIGIGNESKGKYTPLGKFTIQSKLIDPPWQDPNTGILRANDDPLNRLGARWLGFNKPKSDYGIHGTNDDTSIKKKSSDGCIRMHNEDVKEIFDFILRGTTVEITE